MEAATVVAMAAVTAAVETAGVAARWVQGAVGWAEAVKVAAMD